MKKLLPTLLMLLTCLTFFSQDIKNDSTSRKPDLFVICQITDTAFKTLPKRLYDTSMDVLFDFKDGDTINIYGAESSNVFLGDIPYKQYYLITYIDGIKGYIKNKMHTEFNDEVKEYVGVKFWKEYKDGCQYYKNEVDEFSGDKKIFTKTYNLDTYKEDFNSEISISLRSLNGEKYVIFYTSHDLGCAVSHRGNKSSVKIKLENGTIVSFYHFGKTDCGNFSIIANLTKSDISKLKQSPIKTIRLSGTDLYHDIESVKWKTFFIDKLDCIK